MNRVLTPSRQRATPSRFSAGGTPIVPDPSQTTSATTTPSSAELLAILDVETNFAKFAESMHDVMPSMRDDSAWIAKFANLKLDTDNTSELSDFYVWKQRMEIALGRTPWLIYPPRDISTGTEFEQQIFVHFDQLLLGVLSNNVSGTQLLCFPTLSLAWDLTRVRSLLNPST